MVHSRNSWWKGDRADDHFGILSGSLLNKGTVALLAQERGVVLVKIVCVTVTPLCSSSVRESSLTDVTVTVEINCETRENF